jgi:hypothetical protein
MIAWGLRQAVLIDMHGFISVLGTQIENCQLSFRLDRCQGFLGKEGTYIRITTEQHIIDAHHETCGSMDPGSNNVVETGVWSCFALAISFND